MGNMQDKSGGHNESITFALRGENTRVGHTLPRSGNTCRLSVATEAGDKRCLESSAKSTFCQKCFESMCSCKVRRTALSGALLSTEAAATRPSHRDRSRRKKLDMNQNFKVESIRSE